VAAYALLGAMPIIMLTVQKGHPLFATIRDFMSWTIVAA